MRNLSPSINYYNHHQQQQQSNIISPIVPGSSSGTNNLAKRRLLFLPFRERFNFQRKIPLIFNNNNNTRILCSPTSPTTTTTSPISSSSFSSKYPRFHNLFSLKSPTKEQQQFGSISPKRLARSSSFHSSTSPTRSALRNLFRGSSGSGRKSVSFSSPEESVSESRQNEVIRAQSPVMDWKQSISTDHTDIAYRQAVSRLRSILTPRPQSATPPSHFKENLDKNTGSSPLVTRDDSPPSKRDRLSSGLRALFPSSSFDRDQFPGSSNTLPLNNVTNPYAITGMPITVSDQDDLFNFIEKQAAYIAQLEKESNYSRNELAAMLNHVRQVVSENEQLHEKQKQELFTTMIQQLNDKTDARSKKAKDNSSDISKSQQQLIRDSRVAELEAQLSQTKRTLRSAQEEILELRKNPSGNSKDIPTSSNTNMQAIVNEEHNAKMEALNREKEDLVATLTKLKEQINELRDRESEATKKVKSSLEIVEQMQMEKAQSDLETRRVKDELDRHQQRIRELIQDHSRKLYEEKLQVENKYRQEIDILNNEMNQEMDTLTKAKIELERQKRIETDLRRELQLRTNMIEDLRQEMQMKLNHLQNELSSAMMQRSKGDQDTINSRLLVEKIERDAKQDVARLQIEIAAMRKRAEDADAENLKCQEVISKLNEKISHMQHENSIARMRLEERGVPVPGTGEGTGISNDVVCMIQIMEDKHSREMTELEHLVQVQNNLLDKLRDECKLLTDKLEHTSHQYKKEKQTLYAEKDRLVQQNRLTSEKQKDMEYKVQHYKSTHDQLTERIRRLEDDDKIRSERIFQLLSKQSGLLKENQTLQNEVALLKCKRRNARLQEDDDDLLLSTTISSNTTTSSSSTNRGIH